MSGNRSRMRGLGQALQLFVVKEVGPCDRLADGAQTSVGGGGEVQDWLHLGKSGH